MKKILLSIAACFSVLTMTSLMSCNNELIFPLIDEEVSLEKGITGDIYSIVRYKDSIFLSNGKIYKKSAELTTDKDKTNGQWQLVNKEKDKQFLYLASDSQYLYALVSEGYSENSNGNNTISTKVIYCFDDNTWTKIESIEGSIDTIFCNNAYKNDQRRAYIKISDSLPLLLNGTNAPVEVNDVFYTKEGLGKLSEDSHSCTCYNDHDYFTSYDSVTSNSKYVYYSKYVASTSSSNTSAQGLFYSNGDEEKKVSIKNILSLSVTSDSLLLGTTTGIARVDLYEGVPYDNTSKFLNNGNSIFNMYSFVTFVLDPSLPLDDNDLYASATIYGKISSSGSDPINQGLYAYYKVREEWNKDGTSEKNGN